MNSSNYNMSADFCSIRTLLILAINAPTEICTDSSIITMVQDALSIIEDQSNVVKINRSMFDYTMYLQQYGSEFIVDMNPTSLNKKDCLKLLEVFK